MSYRRPVCGYVCSEICHSSLVDICTHTHTHIFIIIGHICLYNYIIISLVRNARRCYCDVLVYIHNISGERSLVFRASTGIQ